MFAVERRSALTFTLGKLQCCLPCFCESKGRAAQNHRAGHKRRCEARRHGNPSSARLDDVNIQKADAWRRGDIARRRERSESRRWNSAHAGKARQTAARAEIARERAAATRLRQTIAAEGIPHPPDKNSTQGMNPSAAPFRAWIRFGRFTQGGADFVSLALGYFLSGFQPFQFETQLTPDSNHVSYCHESYH